MLPSRRSLPAFWVWGCLSQVQCRYPEFQQSKHLHTTNADPLPIKGEQYMVGTHNVFNSSWKCCTNYLLTACTRASRTWRAFLLAKVGLLSPCRSISHPPIVADTISSFSVTKLWASTLSICMPRTTQWTLMLDYERNMSGISNRNLAELTEM